MRRLLKLSTLLIGISLTAGRLFPAQATETLPSGGTDFDSAVELTEGEYEGGAMEDEEVGYYYIDGIDPGQELHVSASFTAGDPDWGANAQLKLYNESEEELVSATENVSTGSQEMEVSWLPSQEENTSKFYLLAGPETWSLGSFDLTLAVEERYDSAVENSDVGDSYDTAVEVSSGSYTGSLAGDSGSDTDDYYKVQILAGQDLTAKLTPEGDTSFDLAIYDANRSELVGAIAENDGEILEATVTAEATEDVYVVVTCDGYWCSEGIADYTLEISGAEATDTTAAVTDDDDTGTTTDDTEEGEETEEGGLFRDEEGNLRMLAIIGIIVGLVVIGGIAIFVVLLASKKKQPTQKQLD